METPSKSHIGRKISRIRELRGMKQEALAQALGVSQQTVSILENSEEVDDKRLKDVAQALGVSKEAIENFSEEAVFQIIGNTYNDSNVVNGHAFNCNFNPLDKLIEVYAEKEKLYERLLEAEREKNVYLERLLDRK